MSAIIDIDALHSIVAPEKKDLAVFAMKYADEPVPVRSLVAAKISVNMANTPGVKPGQHEGIDTIRRPRSGADTVALAGVAKYRAPIAGAMMWLLRFQRGVLTTYRQPEHRVENSDIQMALANHPNISQAAERCHKIKRLVNHSVITFLYYVMASKDAEIADKMVDTLHDPSGIPMSNPFFMFRLYLTGTKSAGKIHDPLMTIALAFKAANAISRGDKLGGLFWKPNGKTPEEFPVLRI